MNNTNNTWAMVTGASGGIGLELARLLAADGYNLILVARREAVLIDIKSELEKKYSVKVHALAADLAIEKEVTELIGKIQSLGIFVNVLVNNAGVGDALRFDLAAPEKLNQMVQLNITSLTMLTRAFLPAMMAAKSGKIMNVASVAAFMPGPYMAVYYATKAYVLSLTEALAAECNPFGIQVSALCPGPVDTGFEAGASTGGLKLFQKFKPLVSQANEVALYGYKSLKKGRVVAIYGIMFKLNVFFMRFTPRFATRKMIAWIQG